MKKRYSIQRHDTACWIVDNYTGKKFTAYPLNQIDLLRLQVRQLNKSGEGQQ